MTPLEIVHNLKSALTRPENGRSQENLQQSHQGAGASDMALAADKGSVEIGGVGKASVRTASHGKRLKLDLITDEPKFISWLEASVPSLLQELHERWRRLEDDGE